MHADSFKPPEHKDYRNPLLVPWLLILLIVHSWASMIHPLIRTKFGHSYFRGHEFFGFVVFWMFVGHSVHPSNYGLFIVYSVAVFAMMIWHSAKANRSGSLMDQHYRYNGKPILMRIIPVNEDTTKGLIEPIAICLIGLTAFHNLDQQFGVFLMIGAGMCLFDFGRVYDREMYKMRRTHQAEMDMRYHQQQYENYKRGRR